jgi:hypothetical protein
VHSPPSQLWDQWACQFLRLSCLLDYRLIQRGMLLRTWSIVHATDVEPFRALVECCESQRRPQIETRTGQYAPLPVIVIGVMVDEALGAITGVPAAVVDPTKDAANRLYPTLGFILDRISGGNG